MKKLSNSAKMRVKLLGTLLCIGIAVQACKSDAKTPQPEPKPVTLQVKVFTAAPSGFQVNSTLIMGDKDAVLVDAQFTTTDASNLVKTIQESKKNLTTVYITHSHLDHYFGLVEIKKAFPNAKIVALPATVTDIQKTWKDRLAYWKTVLGETITSNPVFPEPMEGSTLTLEGQSIQIVGGTQGDIELNSYVWIPSIKAAICGDIDYNGVYPYTIETTPAQRKAWANSITAIQALNPAIVVAGHKNPSLKDDAASLDFTKAYLAHYDSVLPSATSSDDFQNKVKAKYPDLDLPIILKLAADALFP
ncbi:MAG: MBL fold metallo-hydrolase [Sphingobacteriales bacterium]|nr:MAG: MBL fold metallo-hydrolase [Sphingobacteriales bacterium]